jgi:hypothetical protein
MTARAREVRASLLARQAALLQEQAVAVVVGGAFAAETAGVEAGPPSSASTQRPESSATVRRPDRPA